MILPCDDVPFLEHRPPLGISAGKRWAIRLAAPLLRPWNAARHKRAWRAAERMYHGLVGCECRERLEAVLGKPAYSLPVDQFSFTSGGITRRPEHVEVYLILGYTIDVLFYTDKPKIEFVMRPSPTAIDVLLGWPETAPQTFS